MAKTHLRHPKHEGATLCGMPIEGPWNALPIAPTVDAFFALKRRHQCEDCRKAVGRAAMGRAQKPKPKRPRTRPAEPAPEPPFVAPPPSHLTVEEYTERARSRTLGRTGRRAIERSVRGEPLERKWSSAEAAIRAWHASGCGSPMRSSSSFGGRVQTSRDPSLGGPKHAEIDRHRNTALAWTRAYHRLWLERGLLETVVLWRLTDASLETRKLATQGAVGIAWDRILGRANPEQLAEDETARWRRIPETRVTAHQIRHVVGYFVRAVHTALVASGEIEERRGATGAVESSQREAKGWDPLRRIRGDTDA
jgi:hypothetical protein